MMTSTARRSIFMQSMRLALVCLACTGCNHAPSFDIIGSFFPVWMICLTVSIPVAFIARAMLIRFHLETEVGPGALFYPCVVVLCSCLLWLIFFR